MDVTVTGGSGYVGAVVARALADRGDQVRVLDNLLHGQHDVAAALAASGIDVIVGDVRDRAARVRAMEGVHAVVHLAAIVGDPACGSAPELATSVNRDGSRAVAADAREMGIARLVFASTCSTYGRIDDPSAPIDETREVRPASLYASQKAEGERDMVAVAVGNSSLSVTCLRFATVYGVSPRMRFDLTVNQFTRDLWLGRVLEVYGAASWRPYVHVRDASRAVIAVLDAAPGAVAGSVFNVGATEENYTKRQVAEIAHARVGRGEVVYLPSDSDRRDYRVSCERIRRRLGFATSTTLPEGVDEVVAALAADR